KLELPMSFQGVLAPSEHPTPSWANFVGDLKRNLRFVGESLSFVVDRVLYIPKVVVNIGLKRLESAVVAPPPPPPPRAAADPCANRLWVEWNDDVESKDSQPDSDKENAGPSPVTFGDFFVEE
ncbi:hypothetical protein LINGRAHAP2_LOCUS3837, partial [Linum grandiflorum]